MEFFADILEYVGVRWLLSRILQFRPRIRKEGNVLIATSGLRAQVCSLGFGARAVEVDPRRREVRISVRRFWLFAAARTVRFADIVEVLYEYSDVGIGLFAYQQMDIYLVGLILSDGQRVPLFRFFGEGDFVNYTGWPDWLYWDDIAMADMTKGDQERQSLMYADLLGRIIGVPVGRPIL